MTRWQESQRCQASERAAISARLENGHWIDLGDAIEVTGWADRGALYRLGRFRSRGRCGSPVAPMAEISPRAWLHVRATVRDGDLVAMTAEGMVIYESQFALPIEAPAAVRIASEEIHEPIALDLATVFEQLADLQDPAGAAPSIETYRAALEQCGLSLTSKGRVPGVTIGLGCAIARAASTTSVKLSTLLIYIEFRCERHRFSNLGTRRDTVRALYSWLATTHSNLPDARYLVNATDDSLDQFGEKLFRLAAQEGL